MQEGKTMKWIQAANESILMAGEAMVLTVPGLAGCTDTFEEIEPGAWKWTRRCDKPVTEMKMLVRHAAPVSYWQVPSVNYDGNGWGSGAQYSGYGCDGENWTYAWHRVAIPACTYAESSAHAVGLFGGEEGGMSCSIWEEDGCACQTLIWPEVEGPKCLSKRCWWERYQGSMEPADTFTAYLWTAPVKTKRKSYQQLTDFAWKCFERPLTMKWQPEELIRLDTLYFRQLWTKRYDGLIGFAGCMYWNEPEGMYQKSHIFELGWVGQNASVACTLLREYLKNGDVDLRDKAISALDSWMKYAVQPNGLMLVKLKADPYHLDSVANGNVPVELDACNLGTGAIYLLKASKLAEKAGCPRPEYAKAALDLCDFALRVQKENGELAKSWTMDGTVSAEHGSVGAFFVLPLFDAYEYTGDQKYLDAALKGLAFYYGEFEASGVTTAGALDSFCIDKESAPPVLRGCLRAYHLTQDRKYVSWAEEIAYYLNTWQWHYSIHFPKGSIAYETGFDTFGSTSVSAAHNALDHYGLYYVPEFLELAKLTGKDIWRRRARALWYSGTQLISDGTLVINNKVRPAGSQDESMRHTRWGRTDKRYFVTSEFLIHWSGSFRQVALDMLENWDELR